MDVSDESGFGGLYLSNEGFILLKKSSSGFVYFQLKWDEQTSTHTVLMDKMTTFSL